MDHAQNPFHILALHTLAPSPTNPRKTFDESDLADLAGSIREHGVMQPIVVRLWPDEYPTPDGREARPLYEIVAGERRYRGSLLAGMADIPAIVRVLTTRQVLEIQIVENLQRRDVSELEEAEGYDLMMREHGYTADELAEKVGKSRAYIYGRLKLTALCPAAREAYRTGKLNASVALLVARIPGAALQEKATKEVTEGLYSYAGEPMSARQAAQHIQNRYMLRLDQAPFAMDAHLVVKVKGLMGEGEVAEIKCTDCSNRTGNNPELYPDVKSADVCTDPDCFAAKKAAWLERQKVEAKAKGQTVIAGKDVEKIAPHGTSYTLKGYERLDDRNYAADLNDDGTHPTHRQILLGREVPTTLIEDARSGKLVEVIETKALAEAMKAAGIKVRQDSHSEQAKKNEAAAKAESEFRRRLFDETRTAIRIELNGAKSPQLKADDMRLVARQFWSRIWHEGQKKLARIYVVTEEKIDDHARIHQVGELIDTFNAAQLVQFLFDLSLIGTLDVPTYTTSLKTPAPLIDTAQRFGVRPDDIRKTIKAEHAAKTAKKSTAKPASTPPDAARASEGSGSKKQKTTPPATQAARADDQADGKDEEQAAIAARDGMEVPYRHPAYANLGWSGRGKKPRWVRDWLAEGGTLDQLAAPVRCNKTIDIFQHA